MKKFFTFWREKSALEIFKFSLYLVAPVMSSAIYANPQAMKDIIMSLKLIQYPESAPAPPVGDEIHKYVEQAKLEMQEFRAQQRKDESEQNQK